MYASNIKSYILHNIKDFYVMRYLETISIHKLCSRCKQLHLFHFQICPIDVKYEDSLSLGQGCASYSQSLECSFESPQCEHAGHI